MAQKPFAQNPFYVLVLLAGTVFLVTSIAYGFMVFQQLHLAGAFASQQASHPLVVWLRSYGNHALVIELALLISFAFAAMGTDRFWDARRDAKSDGAAAAEHPVRSQEILPGEFLSADSTGTPSDKAD